LVRRGLVFSLGGLAAAVSEAAAPAAVPPGLLGPTVKAGLLLASGSPALPGLVSAHVATLTEGVLKTMKPNRLICTAVLVLSMSAAGAGWLFSGEPRATSSDFGPVVQVAEQADEIDPGWGGPRDRLPLRLEQLKKLDKIPLRLDQLKDQGKA